MSKQARLIALVNLVAAQSAAQAPPVDPERPPAASPPPAGEGEDRAPVARVEAGGSTPRTRGGGPDGGGWRFGYAGYFRAPMRIGLGQSGGPQFYDPVTNPGGLVPYYQKVDTNGDGVVDTIQQGTDAAGNPAFHARQLTLHEPVIPDDQYTHWQFTGHNKKDWAEMFFSVGNGTVSGNLAVQAFRFTDPNWVDTGAQIGIGQGWVELKSDLGFDDLSLNAKVGAHWNRYGMAGVYDSGEYDTYLIGRTHVMGGTTRLDVDLGGTTIGIEGGVGVNSPDPHMANRARFTVLAHGHGFFKLGTTDLGLHLLHAWSAQEVVPQYPPRLPSYQSEEYDYMGNEFPGGPDSDYGVFGPEYPNGSQTIVGIDGKFSLGLWGYLFAGYAHMFLSNALTVSDAIESVHAFGGGEFSQGATDIYLESPYCPHSSYGSVEVTSPAPGSNLHESCSNGTGSIGSALLQYELGLANFGIFPGAQDLKLSLYGMLNFISVDPRELVYLNQVREDALASVTDPAQVPGLDAMKQDGTIKVKFGADAEYFALDFLSLGFRADHVRPHSKVPEQAFTVISPRVSVRSSLVTREEITLQYSHYIYARRQCQSGDAVASPAADPYPMAGVPGQDLFSTRNPVTGLPLRVSCTQPSFGGSPQYGFGSYPSNLAMGTRGAPTLLPDEHVVKLEASMWW